jgi:8-oxo-dGTP diphosphatase
MTTSPSSASAYRRIVRRPSVYAVIKNGLGQVALVRTVEGVFLPGGGIEVDETPEQAVMREVREECGSDIRLLSRLRNAIQLVYSQAELTHFEKASTFFAAVVEGHRSDPSQNDHEVLWVMSSDAPSLVSHESHRWALGWSVS